EGDTLRIRKAERLCPVSGEIPGDFSSASFFIAGAAMTEGSELTVRGVCLNPTRTGFLDVLKRMGAKIEVTPKGEVPEPIGDIRVLGSRLRGTRVRPEEIPSLIDELPVLMVLMSLSQGESLVSGAGELRVKETDRIQAMVQNLKAVGASIEELPDGCMVRGIDRLNGGTVQSYADHRTAMSLAVASLACRGEIRIENTDCVAISFPGFFADFLRLRQSV
ncbi:MAG: 3-phosphoshikimate 1-carboxyvinyltransferase, partial [Candidatus Omnitrophota bacterium]